MADFNLYKPLLVIAEGGYQDFDNDNGNYNSRGELVGTNHGISAPVYEKWIGYPPSVSDMKAITKTVAFEIYKAWYWDRLGASDIENQSVANIIVDHGVNAGLGSIGKITQRVLNNYFGYNLSVDGAIGSKTRTAINSVLNQKKLHDRIKEHRELFYKSLGGEWVKAWLNRLKIFVFSEKKKISLFVSILALTGIGFYVSNILKNN